MKYISPSISLLLCLAAIGCDRQQPAKTVTPVSSVTSVTTVTTSTEAVTTVTEPRYEATLAEGIDFKRTGLPTFVTKIEGLSSQEDWGRWSDANLTPSIKIHFANPLPQKFTLEIKERGIFDNTSSPTRVLIGGVEQSFIANKSDKVEVLNFNLSKPSSVIEIVPPHPNSAKDLGLSADARRLGIGIVSLKIVEI